MYRNFKHTVAGLSKDLRSLHPRSPDHSILITFLSTFLTRTASIANTKMAPAHDPPSPLTPSLRKSKHGMLV